MRRYAFYPGCTLHSTGVEFGVSSELVCERLGLEMVEIADWNCCGASSAHSMSAELTLSLPARNLVKAQETGLESLAIPCAACYSRLAAAGKALAEDGGFRGRMEEVLGVRWEGRVRPRSLLEVVVSDVGREELAGAVRKPLAGLKVASYYGCLLVRPPEYTGRWDDPEHPQTMDYLLGLMGAEVVPWSYGVDCCGGSLTLNRSDVVVHLVDRLVRAAHEAGAEALATACPMCMANVDGRQLYRGGRPLPRPAKAGYEPVPVFYFTELMALAYDLPMGKVLGRHMVDPRPLLKRVGVI
ncbi:MAG TPA: CoB--CoM heterodisulfide reductase iron-sulfur subunit B family protein [Anaerolineae bacterium]|nr:CoB--CoM heterodisulfide reductase iron-sulfur subunit B family protein [Anaerolineae bacterium]